MPVLAQRRPLLAIVLAIALIVAALLAGASTAVAQGPPVGPGLCTVTSFDEQRTTSDPQSPWQAEGGEPSHFAVMCDSSQSVVLSIAPDGGPASGNELAGPTTPDTRNFLPPHREFIYTP